VAGDIVVEIGAYLGHTAVFMAQVLQSMGKRIPVLSIDPFDRGTADALNPQGSYAGYIGSYAGYIETIRASDVANLCLPLAAFSYDAAPVVPAQVGVVVIDGDHHAVGIINDLRSYAPKVRPNGFIFIDDYALRFPGIVRAVDDFFEAEGSFELIHKSYFVVGRRRPEPMTQSAAPSNAAYR
jgi:cephalosporin hydroxylase